MNRDRRGILDIDLLALIRAIPDPVRPWAFAVAVAAGIFWISHQVGLVDAKVEAHKADHAAQAAKLDTALNEIHSQLLLSVAQIPALQIQAVDAKQQADRANARLDGAERDPAYAGGRR
jgi:hypothetical protein